MNRVSTSLVVGGITLVRIVSTERSRFACRHRERGEDGSVVRSHHATRRLSWTCSVRLWCFACRPRFIYTCTADRTCRHERATVWSLSLVVLFRKPPTSRPLPASLRTLHLIINMSGAEAITVVGLISSVITIIQTSRDVYDAATSAKGLPKAFRAVSNNIPLVLNILRDCRQVQEQADRA